MSLNFPTNGDTTYTDDCGNKWVYDASENTWTIDPPVFEIDTVDPDSIWVRSTNGTITTINSGDVLDMGTKSSDIDLKSFPDI